MADVQGRDREEAEAALVPAVVRVKGLDGAIGGAGFLIAADLVLTCAHVVSDALDRPRDEVIAPGTGVRVDVPLAGNADGVDGGEQSAEVWHWIPIRPDQTGDVAVLRLRRPIGGARPLPLADAHNGVWDHDARAVGFTDDHPDGIWQSGRFRGPTRQGWIQLSRADNEAVHVKGGFSGSPVWDDELGAAVGMMVAAQPVREAQQAFVLRTRTLLKEVPELAAHVDPPTPFRGLATFQEEDADVFFGRDDDIERVVTALRGERAAVTVYGPSGCGKSSLALAGVVPRMRRQGHVVLQVDATRWTSLRAALATELFEKVRAAPADPPRATSVDQVESWLAELGLADTVHRTLGASAGPLLVVLDQAEALLGRSRTLADEAADLLLPERPQPGTRVLLTLRADLMDEALRHPRLGPALKRGVTVPLTPMSREQLAEVVSRPLQQVPTVEYEPGLERRILDDAGGEPGILPLLGFVLAQLWDHKRAGRLRVATYEANGGVSGALRHHAEQAWRECVGQEHADSGDDEEAEALRLLTGLVQVLPGSEVPLRRLLTRDETGETRWRIAQALAARRLLVLHGDEGEPQSVELAHEALVGAWPTLARQVRTDAEFLAGRAELEHDIRRWLTADKAADLLPGSVQLVSLRGQLRGRESELTTREREFIHLAERRHRGRRNRVRAAWIAAAVVLALLAGLGTFLVYQQRISTQRDAEGRSRALAVQSDGLTDSNPGKAALAALAGYETAPTLEARSALMRRYEELRDAAWMLTGAEGPIQDAAMSADGVVSLVTTETGRATLFVRSAKGRIRQEQLRLGVNVLVPAVSRDGRRIAYVHDADGTVTWHDVHPTGRRLLGPAHRLSGELPDISMGAYGLDVKIMDFSPDGNRLVAVSASSAERPVRVWDLRTGRFGQTPGRTSGLSEVWSGPDPNTIVARRSDDDGTMLAVDLRTGRLRQLAKKTELDGNAVSGDGSVVITCRLEKKGPDDLGEARYQAIRVSDGRMLNTYKRGENASCWDIAVNERGTHFAVMGSTGEWTLVETRRGGAAKKFLGPTSTEEVKSLPLLGTSDRPVLVSRSSEAVTGWAMVHGDGKTTFSPPHLLDNGSSMVVRLGEQAEILRVMRTEGENQTLAEVRIKAAVPPSAKQELQVNDDETLVADVSDRNRVTVRELPSLRRVAQFTTARLPAKSGKSPNEGLDLTGPELLVFRFLNDRQLLTVSGTRVEQWDARTGRRLARPIDLPDLHLSKKKKPAYFVGRHREPGHLSVTVHGEPYVFAIDKRTGKENEKLRLRLGDDLGTAVFLRDSRYAAVYTVGGMVELWSAPPGRTPERVAGPLGPLNENRWTGGGFGDTGFFVANDSSVRFVKADDPAYQDWYEFKNAQGFLAASEDGKALLKSPEAGGRVDLLRLDPARWERHVCAVLGRDLTPDERGSLPSGLPDEVCPD